MGKPTNGLERMKTLIFILLLQVANLPVPSGKVQQYLDGHRTQWYGQWKQLDIVPEMAEAVVYPELLRYSAIRDIVENTLNYSTYIQKGKEGFDFSVGRFQIKPSFVEKLEKAWMSSGLAPRYNIWFDTRNTRDARKKRIQRLQEETWQCTYVGLFIRMLFHYYHKDMDRLSKEEQLRLAATAYNRGCKWPPEGNGSLDGVLKHLDDRSFHFELGSGKYILGTNDEPAPHYCYGDISLDWFNRLNTKTNH